MSVNQLCLAKQGNTSLANPAAILQPCIITCVILVSIKGRGGAVSLPDDTNARIATEEIKVTQSDFMRCPATPSGKQFCKPVIWGRAAAPESVTPGSWIVVSLGAEMSSAFCCKVRNEHRLQRHLVEFQIMPADLMNTKLGNDLHHHVD